jgi:hypothetical protein
VACCGVQGPKPHTSKQTKFGFFKKFECGFPKLEDISVGFYLPVKLSKVGQRAEGRGQRAEGRGQI